MNETNTEPNRGFFRVAAQVGLRVEPVGPEQWAETELALQADPTAVSKQVEPELAAWLERLERKLDLVLEQVGAPVSMRAEHPEVQEVMLSGSGIRFDAGHAFDEGAPVRIDLELPGSPSVLIQCLGKIVRLEDSGDAAHPCAIRFEVIREVDRDRIVQHTLAIQRHRLQQGRGAA